MTQVLDRATIELARAETLDALEAAKERLDEASLAAALPGGEDGDMLAAEQEVSRLRQKLQGLAHGLKQVERQERERHEAERLLSRREQAVRILALIHRRYWATEELDEALSRAGKWVFEIEDLGNQILIELGGMSEGDRREFLMCIDALDMTDTTYKVHQNISRLRGDYSKSLLLSRPMAVRVLAKYMPEVLDQAVKAEAVASARAERASDA